MRYQLLINKSKKPVVERIQQFWGEIRAYYWSQLSLSDISVYKLTSTIFDISIIAFANL